MGAAFESVLTFLFKYPLRVYERGDVVLAPVVPVVLLAAVGIAALVLITAMYRRVQMVSRRDRAILGAFRILCVAIVLGCLLRPTIVVSSAVAQRNVLAVLFDDSRSMRLRDVDDASRMSALQRVFADSSALLQKLSEKFALRTFRFAADAGPSSGAKVLTASGARTDLAGALDVTREDLAGMPLAGIIVVTDGAYRSTPWASARSASRATSPSSA